jgi:glycosyltransferase involved in cell wall biosynthesis
MKILYHHRTRLEDAQAIHIYEMVEAFRNAGHDVEVAGLVSFEATKGQKKERRKWLDWRPPNWLHELMSLAYNVYGLWQLYKSARSRKPDFIYERYALNTFCGIWIARCFGIPLVLEVNAPLYYEQSKLGNLTFKRMARFSERWICSHSTLTIVVSQVIKAFLIRQGVPGDKIVVLPNGVNPRQFHTAISGETIRSRYSLEGKCVLGFVGWFRPWHGLELLLDVLLDKRFQNHGLHLLLAGDGPAYSTLYQHAERHNLLSGVTFTGAVGRADIPEYIAAMDIAVQPSAPEYACPMKIIEYMAMGKCIVAPDMPNIREIIDKGINGYLFQPAGKDEFYAIILELIKNPALRSEAGRNAAKTISERGLLWSSNAERVVGFIETTRLSSIRSTAAAASRPN